MPKCRSTRHKKRRFVQNQHTKSKQTDLEKPKSPLPCSTDGDKQNNILPCSSVTNRILDTGFRIFDCEILKEIVQFLACPQCMNSEIVFQEISQEGLSSTFTISCNSCDFFKKCCSSKKVKKTSEVNTRLVYAMRQLGQGHSGAKKFCAFMNCQPPLSSRAYSRLSSVIGKSVMEVSVNSMVEAAEEVKSLKKDKSTVVPCGVSVDGTWQRRGFSSLNGCVSVLSIDTGKVLDVETLSSYCQTCKTKKKKTAHTCTKNYDGSARTMEPVGAYRIFERSQEKRGLAYVDFYGDGDSKSYLQVKDVYEDFTIRKLECIGHVQKRVGNRLRKLKKIPFFS